VNVKENRRVEGRRGSGFGGSVDEESVSVPLRAVTLMDVPKDMYLTKLSALMDQRVYLTSY
jgi:hypothetical protein